MRLLQGRKGAIGSLIFIGAVILLLAGLNLFAGDIGWGITGRAIIIGDPSCNESDGCTISSSATINCSNCTDNICNFNNFTVSAGVILNTTYTGLNADNITLVIDGPFIIEKGGMINASGLSGGGNGSAIKIIAESVTLNGSIFASGDAAGDDGSILINATTLHSPESFSEFSGSLSLWVQTIANEGYGKINYSDKINFNNKTTAGHIIISENYAYINPSYLGELNDSASITLYGVSEITANVFGDDYILVDYDGDGVMDGACNDCSIESSWSGGEVTFSVPHFTGYSYGANANLVIYDESDPEGGGVKKDRYESVAFFANYTNLTGDPINNADCNITIIGASVDNIGMVYDSGSELYIYNITAGFSYYGTYDWNVTCTHNIYTNLFAADNITISATSPPMKPIVWPVDDVVYTSTINVIGYIDEDGIEVKAHVKNNPELNGTDISGNLSHLKYVCSVNEPINATRFRSNCTLIKTTHYLMFENHNKTYFKRYDVKSVLDGSGENYITLASPLEDTISAGEKIYVYEEEYPSGWFNISLPLKQGESNTVEVAGYNGLWSEKFIFTVSSVFPKMTINISLPADNATFNAGISGIDDLPDINTTFTPISNAGDSNFSCGLYVSYNGGSFVLKASNASTANNTLTAFTLYNNTPGDYSWKISCVDGGGTTVSDTWNFYVVDAGSPVFNLSSITSPTPSNTPTLHFGVYDLTGVNESTIFLNATDSDSNSVIYNSSAIDCDGDPTSLQCDVTLDYSPSGFYNLSFFAMDYLGNFTTETISGYQIASTGPTVILVNDSKTGIDGNLFSNKPKNNITADILGRDDETPIEYFMYSIGTEYDMTKLLSWTRVNASTDGENYTATITPGDLDFRHLVMYYIYAYAVNTVGLNSSIVSSDGVLFEDNTEPTTPNVVDSGVYTTDNTVLHFSWSSSDPESGIAYYEIMLGDSSNNNSVFNWKSAGNTTEGSFYNSFAEGTNYTLYVRARSNAGHWSSTGKSNGITIDTIRPYGGNISYTDGYETGASSRVNITVGYDNTSGIQSVRLVVTRTDLYQDFCTGGGWTQYSNNSVNKNKDHVIVPVASGYCYRFDLIVKDGAGLAKRYGGTDILKIDSTSPTIYTAIDEGDSFSTRVLKAELQGLDYESSISQFNFSITITNTVETGGTIIYGWKIVNASYYLISVDESELKNHNLTHGEIYYFNVKAKNHAGLWSPVGSSNGIVWRDEEPPVTWVVTVAGNINGTYGYVDMVDNGKTNIIIEGDKEDIVCKYYTKDVHYQADSGTYCSLVGGHPYRRNCSVSTFSEGTYTRHISCRDQYNNQQTEDNNLDVTWTADFYPPSVSITAPLENENLGYDITLSANIVDTGIGIITLVSYNITNETNSTVHFGNLTYFSGSSFSDVWNSVKTNVSSGKYYFNVWATDALNQTSPVHTRAFNIDNKNVSVQIITPEEDKYYGENFSIYINVQDDLAINYTYYTIKNSSMDIVSQGNASPNNQTYAWNASISLTDGEYLIEVYADDYSGNSVFKNRTFYIDVTPPEYSNASVIKTVNVEDEKIYNNESVILSVVWTESPNNLSWVSFNHSTNSTYVYEMKGINGTDYTHYLNSSYYENQETVLWQSCAADTIGNEKCTPWLNFTIENRPPHVRQERIPAINRTFIVQEDSSILIDLNAIFVDPDKDPLTFSYRIVGVSP